MPGRPSHIALLLAIATLPCAAQAPVVTPVTIAPFAANPGYIRFGAPITFSGRVLPADATGTLTFLIDGLASHTVPLNQQSIADYIALGDSITAATYIADPAQRYPNLVAQALNRNLFNYAVPGYKACDIMPLEALPFFVGESLATNPVYSLLVGTNDLRSYGVGDHEQTFNLCHQATLAWLGVPPANKVLIPATTGPTTHIALTTTGAPAYLWYGIQTNATGSFTVSIDGAAPNVLTQTQANPVGNVTSSYGLLRIPIGAGAHTFDITTQSGTVNFLGMGSPVGSVGPTILAGDIPNQTNGDTAGIAAYTADIVANIALLRADGLDIRFISTQQAMHATAAEMMDAVHPNALGLSELAAAFETSNPSAATITAAAASYSTSTLAFGSHGVNIQYSGDSHYVATNSVTFPVVIYDPTSSASLTSDSSIYPVQSSIVLTADVSQSNSSGQVNFVDEAGFLGSAWLNQPTLGAAQLALPSLPAGVHTIIAQYLGDIHYNASSSSPITINVSGTYTTTALSTPATRFYAASPFELTATVSPANATGTVTFFDGSVTLGHSTLVAGVAAFNAAALLPGVHSLTATFHGNATQDPSQSPALAVEIDPNSTTTALSPIPASSPYGTALSITAVVSPASATGTVTFSDGLVNIGQSALPNAALTNATLKPGAHILTAIYSGDTDDLPSISSPVTTLITLTPSAIYLAPIPASNPYGMSLQILAAVLPASATGTVTFSDGATRIGQSTLPNTAFTINTLAPGPHSLTATYSGDNFRAASTSNAVSTTILPFPATITLAPLANPIHAGNPIVLTASINPANANGTVVFRDIALGVLGQATVANGTATLTLHNPASGQYSIAASYSGDTNDAPATSASVTTQIILNPTSTTLTGPTNTVAFATPITFSATITPPAATITSPAATGSVTFFEGPFILDSSLIINGVANLAITTLAPGSHTVHATYSGDTLSASSISPGITVTIAFDPTTTTITLAQNSVAASSNVIANVRVASANTNPTGFVSIRSGATTLATAPLSNASGAFAYATLSFGATTLGLGTSQLTATYSGDSYNQTSSSSAASVTLTAIPTLVTLILSAPQIPLQSNVTLTATVSATTGSITYVSNGTPLATTLLNTPLTFTPSAIGTLSLTATYAANGLYAASNSAPRTLTIAPPLTASLSPTSISAKPGATIPATLTLTPAVGFIGPIQTICKTSSPYITCSLTAPTTITSTTNIPVQIKIATTTASLSRPGLVVLALLLPFLARKQRRRLPTLLLIALCLEGCAEGGNFNSVPPGAQSVTITTTAAGTPIPATLTINITN